MAPHGQRDEVGPLTEQEGLTPPRNGPEGSTVWKALQNTGQGSGRRVIQHSLERRDAGRCSHDDEVSRAAAFQIGQVLNALVDVHRDILTRMHGDVDFTGQQSVVNGVNELTHGGRELPSEAAVA